MVRAVYVTDSNGNTQQYATIAAAKTALGVSATTVTTAIQRGRTVNGCRVSFTFPAATAASAAAGDMETESEADSDVTVADVGPVVQPPTTFVAAAGKDLGQDLVRCLKDDSGRMITTMRADGFLNATTMCSAFGKRWGHFMEMERSQAFVAALAFRHAKHREVRVDTYIGLLISV